MKRLLAFALAALLALAATADARWNVNNLTGGGAFQAASSGPVTPTFIDHNGNTDTSSPVDFASQTLSTSGDRIVVSAGVKGGSSPSITAVTVNGVACTEITQTGDGDATMSLWVTNSGINASTGDISLTVSGTIQRTHISWWSVANYGSVHDSGSSIANSTDPAAVSIDEIASGAILAGAMNSSSGGGTTAAFTLGGGSLTDHGEWNEPSGNDHAAASETTSSSASGTSMSVAWTGGAGNTGLAVVSIAP